MLLCFIPALHAVAGDDNRAQQPDSSLAPCNSNFLCICMTTAQRPSREETPTLLSFLQPSEQCRRLDLGIVLVYYPVRLQPHESTSSSPCKPAPGRVGLRSGPHSSPCKAFVGLVKTPHQPAVFEIPSTTFESDQTPSSPGERIADHRPETSPDRRHPRHPPLAPSK